MEGWVATRQVMRRWDLICALVVAGSSAAAAHDSNVVAAVVYIQPDQIQVVMEMAFPTGMILAGCPPSGEATLENRFAAGQLPLKKFLGGLLEVTADSNSLQALRTNVGLTLEQHIRGSVELATTTNRPLQFFARGLRGASAAPYRVALSVLDLVNRKVLGQAVLAADSPPAMFPPAMASTVAPVSAPTNEAVVVNQGRDTAPRSTSSTPPAKFRWPVALAAFAAVIILLVTWRSTHLRG